LVEHVTENHGVGGSIPSPGTMHGIADRAASGATAFDFDNVKAIQIVNDPG
jgi:hypothetical protein